MVYMGGKTRIAKNILSIILETRKPGQWYVEPFCGGCNTLDKVSGDRIGADANRYLIAMWKALQDGWTPRRYSLDEYKFIRANKAQYPDHVVGWVGFVCSFRGKFFSGYSGNSSDGRDYQAAYSNTLLTQIKHLKSVKFYHCSYNELEIPDNSIIYCDPPYENTSKYCIDFNHSQFWDWVRVMSEKHTVYVSEYNAPKDFKCVWHKIQITCMGKRVNTTIKQAIEKLFVHESLYKKLPHLQNRYLFEI